MRCKVMRKNKSPYGVVLLIFVSCLCCQARATETPQPDAQAKTTPSIEVSPPRKIAGEAPAYPRELRDQGIEGKVTIRIVVTKEGKVGKADLIGSTDGLLTEAVAKVLPTWRFEPARIIETGQPISVEYKLSFPFRLTD